ncbi:macrophage mannose receptor 1-like [Amphibalanus amphitrite]|uniref:macrophage mannose receptor 1-like n=1 Tax=Amphibalanus amphitrite TaxID=1232801 RepID=UPI001C8FB923|nr:macrophage mannose receptor 1-like [Amphibalanus amphitrite]
MLVFRCTLALSLVATAFTDCPGSPWKEWNGHCYRLSASTATWLEIRDVCKHPFKQADVASVGSWEENRFILENILKQQSAWLGLRLRKERRCWTDKSPVKFMHFRSNVPLDDVTDAVVQLAGTTGHWELVSPYGGKKLHAVCKMPSCECKEGWVKQKNRCYKPIKCPLRWLDARERCQRMAPMADLATINSSSENDFLVNMMSNKMPFWIGLNDREQEGEYQWSGAGGETTPAYRNWAVSEPNGARHTEDCVQVGTSGQWSDHKCQDQPKSYVCQQPMCGNRAHPPHSGQEGGAVSSTDGGSPRCPNGWRLGGSKCYSKPTSPESFDRAEELCKEQHPRSHIANVTSLPENDKVFLQASGSLPVWIRHSERGSSNWQTGVTAASSARCATLQSSGQWSREQCDEKHPGICELSSCVPKCPQHWYLFQGNCYFIKGIGTLKHATESCESVGGHLPSILSQDENDFITALIFRWRRNTKHARTSCRPFAFIGASRADKTSPWSWSDGADWGTPRWAHGDGDRGTCAALNSEGRWKSFDCEAYKLMFLCKKDPCRDQFGPLHSPNRDTSSHLTTHPVETLTTAAPRPKPKICPNDGRHWHEESGVCLASFTSSPSTFTSAFKTCTYKKDGFAVSLPVVRFKDTLEALLKLTGGRDVWVGLTRRYTSVWYWHDVVRATDLQWQLKPTADTRCTSIDGDMGGLVARRCSDKLIFFCEARRLPN